MFGSSKLTKPIILSRQSLSRLLLYQQLKYEIQLLTRRPFFPCNGTPRGSMNKQPIRPTALTVARRCKDPHCPSINCSDNQPPSHFCAHSFFRVTSYVTR